jgi:hypothetical protein
MALIAKKRDSTDNLYCNRAATLTSPPTFAPSNFSTVPPRAQTTPQ